MDVTNEDAAAALWQSAYADLKMLARLRIRDAGSARLIDTTALVHESWVKLAAVKHLEVDNRRRFFAYAAKVMRSVVIDIAREHGRQKRGGGMLEVTLDPALAGSLPAPNEPLRLDEALRALEKTVPRLASVVEMRYFGGLSDAEIADVLGVTERTVRRDWDKARLLLREMLEAE